LLIENKTQLNKFPVFTLKDILIIDSTFNLNSLSNWQKKGYIMKLIKGKYIFTDQEINEQFLFLIANELLPFSYVSLDSALSWHGLIPEGVRQVTSVSTLKSIVYNTEIGSFRYNKLKEVSFTGYSLINLNGFKKPYKLATIEKAIADYLYFHTDINSFEAIKSLRINSDIFEEKVNITKLLQLSTTFENKNLERRIKKFIEFFKK